MRPLESKIAGVVQTSDPVEALERIVERLRENPRLQVTHLDVSFKDRALVNYTLWYMQRSEECKTGGSGSVGG